MYLQFNKSWDRVTLEHDAQCYANSENLLVAKSHLASSGLFGLSNVISPQPTAQKYECAWRLSDWTVLENLKGDEAPTFDRSHYAALRCLQTKDEMGAQAAIVDARQLIIGDLRSASLECTNNVYKHLQRLALVQQIDDFLCVQFHRNEPVDRNVFDKWRQQDQIGCSQFEHKEPIMAQRITIARAAGLRATRKLQNTFNVRTDMLQSMILNVASECRLEGRINLAIRYLAVLYNMNTSAEIKVRLDDFFLV